MLLVNNALQGQPRCLCIAKPKLADAPAVAAVRYYLFI